MSDTDATKAGAGPHGATARERDAAEAAVSKRRLDGSVHDVHGEVNIDPEVPDAAEQYRDHVEAVESPEGGAANETLGTTTEAHPRSRRPDHDR